MQTLERTVTRSSQAGHGRITLWRARPARMISGTVGQAREQRSSRASPAQRLHRTAQGATNGAGGETRPVRHFRHWGWMRASRRSPLGWSVVSSPFGFLLASEPPSRRVGVIVALAAVALCTLIVYPLAHVAPVVSLSVVYLPAVLVVSVTWGAWLGVATAVASAAAFNFFHLPPVGRFTLQNSENWVALAAFLVVAVLASSVAEVMRARTRDAEERRREADLAAEMARLLLRGNSLAEALPTAAARLAQALELSSAAIVMDAVEGDERSVAFPLREGTQRLGTLVVG